MENPRSRNSLVALGLCLIVFAAGCTTVSRTKPASQSITTAAPQPETLGWWHARFKMEWPRDAEPRWHMDVLLACEVLVPIIEENRNDVALWRIHRRASRDAAGHQFSLIVYSRPDVAARIFQSIRASTLVSQLQTAGELLSVEYDGTDTIRKPNIEDTSDQHWSPVLQRSWPYFIMGASELWLTLVTQIAEGQASRRSPATLKEKLDFYRQVDQTVQTLWHHEGGHALLHHLNAIFQYEPLMVNRKETLQF